VSEAWKNLGQEERDTFEELARKDKARFEIEKRMYSGPWKVSAEKIRDPKAPKRPCSAFLSFSNQMREKVKKRLLDASSADILRELAKMWKDSPDRDFFIARELACRQEYKIAIAKWRATQSKPTEDARQHREDLALQTLDAQEDHCSTTYELEAAPCSIDFQASCPPTYYTFPPMASFPSADGRNFEGMSLNLSILNNLNSLHQNKDNFLGMHNNSSLSKLSANGTTTLSNSLADMMQISIFPQPIDSYSTLNHSSNLLGSFADNQSLQQHQLQLQQLQLQQHQLLQRHQQLQQLQYQQRHQDSQLDFSSHPW
jgi:HMG (high mobility group) box